jgi:hypothetical protein
MNDMTVPQPADDHAAHAKGALALLAAVQDPLGSKQRIEEIAASAAAHDVAREAAEKTIAEAAATRVKADGVLTWVMGERQKHQVWVDSTTAALDAREKAMVSREAVNERRAAENELKAKNLQAATEAQSLATAAVRTWLQKVEAL